MGSGEVAIVALSTMISLKVTFSDGLGGGYMFEFNASNYRDLNDRKNASKHSFLRSPSSRY